MIERDIIVGDRFWFMVGFDTGRDENFSILCVVVMHQVEF